MIGSDATMEICSQESQLSTVFNLTRQFRGMNENEVFRLTGCLSACDKVMTIAQ